MLTSDQPIIVEQELNTSVDKIWSALTDLSEMHQWFFDNIPEFKAEVGFTTKFDISNEERTFPHVWKVVEVVPLKKIVVQWTFEGYPGSSKVHMEIITKDGKNYLLLTTEVLEDHPQDIPEFRRESGEGGWKYFINDRLKNYLDPAE